MNDAIVLPYSCDVTFCLFVHVKDIICLLPIFPSNIAYMRKLISDQFIKIMPG